jgi:GGDEF domain-containing protein
VAQAKARSLAQAVEREPMRFGDGSAPLQVSWGVCEITEDREPEEIVAAADQAMYAMKRARRA